MDQQTVEVVEKLIARARELRALATTATFSTASGSMLRLAELLDQMALKKSRDR